jgi:hypothetical protein
MLNPTKVEANKKPYHNRKTTENLPMVCHAEMIARTRNMGPAVMRALGFTPAPSAMVRLESELLRSRAHELTEHDGRVVAGLELELQNHSNPAGFGVNAALVDIGTHH